MNLPLRVLLPCTVGQLITDVVLAVFAYVADEDWTERHELQRQGIEVAKAIIRRAFFPFS